MAELGFQRLGVRAQDVDQRPCLDPGSDSCREIFDRNDERRVMDDFRLAILVVTELVEGLVAVVRPRFVYRLPHVRRFLGVQQRTETRQNLFDVQMGVPHRHHRNAGQLLHRFAVGAHRMTNDPLSDLCGIIVLATRNLNAGGQPLDVPFPWARGGLVEVVQVEDEMTLRRTEHAEIRHVCVAAELRVDSRDRGGGQICRHGERGAAEVGERRHHHPPVPDRHQLGHTGQRLLLQQVDRRDAVGGRRPSGVVREGNFATSALSPLRPFIRREPSELA